MHTRTLLLLTGSTLLLTCGAAAQRSSLPEVQRPFTAASSAVEGSNLPFQILGPSDLVRVTVYDSPDLSRSFRVDENGNLSLPLLHKPIKAAGLMPDAVRKEIVDALVSEHLFVSPVVDVSVVEYRSRSVTISGAVKSPVTIQEFGNTYLLDAINDAGGLLAEAGPEIIVEQPSAAPRHILVKELLDGKNPALNMKITGGDTIRVPEAEKIFVVGQVKEPGAFPYTDAQDTTVLKALALSGGLQSFNRNEAYIYRAQAGSTQKEEIVVPLKRILDRKVPDMKLAANDILYVPTNRGLKNTAAVLNHISGMGNTAVSSVIWSSR